MGKHKDDLKAELENKLLVLRSALGTYKGDKWKQCLKDINEVKAQIADLK
jgi:hypothetical protein